MFHPRYGMQPISVFLPDETATLQCGSTFARCIAAPLVCYLNGGLGAGKTTFTRGLLQGMGHRGAVKSPTYTLVESYTLPEFSLHHFDLYRFSSPEEWEEAGLDDLVGATSVCLIEWPQQGAGFAPPADISLTLDYSGSGRQAVFTAYTETGTTILEQWKNILPADN